MKSTTVDNSQLSAGCECVLRKYRHPCTCTSYNSLMNARCRTARARSLSSRPASIGDPISNNGFEFSTNVLHLFRQSALLKSHLVKSRVAGPPSHRPFCLGIFTENRTHIYFPQLEALLDAPCASLTPCYATVASVISVSCSKLPFCKWRWCWRRRQRRTAATATPFPVVT